MSTEVTKKKVWAWALKMTSQRRYSEKEFEEKLLKKYPDATGWFRDILDELIKYGYINDETMAESYISYSFAHRSYSVRKVREKLFKKGIAADIISKYLYDEEFFDEKKVIERLYEKKKTDLHTKQDRVKFVQSLERKGFFLGNVLAVISLE